MPKTILPAESQIYRCFVDLVGNADRVFIAGLPGVGKSLLLQQLTLMALEAGRQVHLLQWDTARQPFETPRYPPGSGRDPSDGDQGDGRLVAGGAPGVGQFVFNNECHLDRGSAAGGRPPSWKSCDQQTMEPSHCSLTKGRNLSCRYLRARCARLSRRGAESQSPIRRTKTKRMTRRPSCYARSGRIFFT